MRIERFEDYISKAKNKLENVTEDLKDDYENWQRSFGKPTSWNILKPEAVTADATQDFEILEERDSLTILWLENLERVFVKYFDKYLRLF